MIIFWNFGYNLQLKQKKIKFNLLNVEIPLLGVLQRRYRLIGKKDFQKVFKKGRGLKEDFLFLKMVKNNLTKKRFGFIVSGKISKKATLRNKIKRRLRELIRRKVEKIKEGVDVVLIALPGLEKKGFWQIGEILDNLLKKASVLKK